MSKAIKFTGNKDADNFETIEGLDEVLRDWLDTIAEPLDGHITVKPLEFQSRDGFIAHRHNHGGLDYISFSSVKYCLGSGYHIGTTVQDFVERVYKDAEKEIARLHPDLAEIARLHPDLALPSATHDDKRDEYYDLIDDYLNDGECFDLAWRIRLMYEGNGVLRIYAGFDLDGPYFRWNDKAEFEHEIKFKTLSGLKEQLEKITKKVEDSAYASRKAKKGLI